MSDLWYNSYIGPAYQITGSVHRLRLLPRFGYNYDVTTVFSSDADAGASYATGLIALGVFILIFFLFWTAAIGVLKVMGPGNAGFLSGRECLYRVVHKYLCM
jgi:hypothetical protein